MIVLSIVLEIAAALLLCWSLIRLASKGGVRPASVMKICMLVGVPTLIFWEWIPTWVAYETYRKQAGFTVIKTLEQWRAENPGATDGLERFDQNPKDPRGQLKPLSPTRFRKQLNQRFAYDIDHTDAFPNIRIWTLEVVDTGDQTTVARHVTVMAGNHGGMAAGGPGWWKFWTLHGPASPGEANFHRFLKAAADIGRSK